MHVLFIVFSTSCWRLKWNEIKYIECETELFLRKTVVQFEVQVKLFLCLTDMNQNHIHSKTLACAARYGSKFNQNIFSSFDKM
jgi:hypothetical protein